MRRLYFLVDDIDCVRRVIDGLLLARVEERHIHVIAKHGAELEELPEASLLQKSDFIPAVERGIAVGGATGVIAGLVAMILPGGLVLGGGAILATALLGAGVGAWISGMIGMDAPNSRDIREERIGMQLQRYASRFRCP